MDAGWVMQDKRRVNLYASLGVAVREMDIDAGPADYMLFVDDKACEVIEAKREGYILAMSFNRATATLFRLPNSSSAGQKICFLLTRQSALRFVSVTGVTLTQD
jgi:type I site-specific restriction endonuclease